MQRLAPISLIALLALAATPLVSPWRPSAKLDIGFAEYIGATVQGEAALLFDPAAMILVVGCCALWRHTPAPIVAGLLYAPLAAFVRYAHWCGLGLSSGKCWMAAATAGLQVCALAALAAALVTAVFVAAEQDRLAPGR